MGQFSKRLSQAREAWKKGRESGPASKVQPGVYSAQLVTAELAESQASNKLMIHREFSISEGEFQGESLHDYMQLETEKGPFFAELWLKKMGYDVGAEFDPVGLEDILAEMTERNPQVRIRVVQKDGFTNIRVLQLLDEGSEPAAPAEPESAADGDAGGGTDAGGEASGDDEAVRAELVTLAQTFSVEVDENDSKDDLVAKLDALSWDDDCLEPSEVALLEGVGIKVAKSKKPAPKAPAARAPAPKAPVSRPAAKPAAKAPVKKPVAKSAAKRK